MSLDKIFGKVRMLLKLIFSYRINNSVYKGNKVFLVSQEDGYSLKVSDMDAGVFGWAENNKMVKIFYNNISSAFKEAYTTKICENKYFLKLFGITYTPDMNPVFIYGGRAKGSLLDVLRNKHQEVTYRLVSRDACVRRNESIFRRSNGLTSYWTVPTC